jgi:putative Mg2+ transporter-C (MgtC) family protein
MIHWTEMLRLTIAYVLALPLAIEREREEQTAGLRTFPLMALASCAVVLIGTRQMEVQGQSRVLQGLLSGIGVICAGSIIHAQSRVHGTATAAAILGTAVMGVAAAYEMYDVAIFLSVVMYLTLKFSGPFKVRLDREAGRTGSDTI